MTQDHLGSPRVITDAVGNVIARKDFSAFGDETVTGQRTMALGYKPENIRQDYTGYQKDDESGLEFAQARYYNSSHGRFTSVDPLTASATIRDPQTFNRYSYALNSPYKFTDPLGLVAKDSGQITENKGCGKSGGRDCIGFGNDYLPEQQAEQLDSPPVSTAQINGVNYVGTLQSSTVSEDNATGSVNVTLNYSWHTKHTDENGNVTRIAVSQEVGDTLNDGLSRMAANIINAHKSLYNLSAIGKTSLTLEGAASLGVKYKKLSATGGDVGGSVTFELNNPNEIKDKTRAINDSIQLQMVINIGEKSMVTAWSGGKEVKLGDQIVSSGVTLPSQLGQMARDEANSYAIRKYSETFPYRIQLLHNY